MSHFAMWGLMGMQLAWGAPPPSVKAECTKIRDTGVEYLCLALVEGDRARCSRGVYPAFCEDMVRYVLPANSYTRCSRIGAEGSATEGELQSLCQGITRRRDADCRQVDAVVGRLACQQMVSAFRSQDAAGIDAAAETVAGDSSRSQTESTDDNAVTRSTSRMDWVTWEGQDAKTAPVIWKMLLGDTEAENGNAQAMGVSIVRPGEIFDLHHHRQPEVYHVLSGEAIVEIGGVAKRAKAGDTFFIPGNAPHVTRAVGDRPFEWAFFFPFQSFDEVGYQQDPVRPPKEPPEDASVDPHRFSVTDQAWAVLEDEDFGQRQMVSKTIPVDGDLKLEAARGVSQVFVIAGNGRLMSGSKEIVLTRQTASSLNPRTEKLITNTGGTPMIVMLMTGADTAVDTPSL